MGQACARPHVGRVGSAREVQAATVGTPGYWWVMDALGRVWQAGGAGHWHIPAGVLSGGPQTPGQLLEIL